MAGSQGSEVKRHDYRTPEVKGPGLGAGRRRSEDRLTRTKGCEGAKMKMKQNAGTTGLLFEIIISTVFFSIICVVVLQMFIHAQELGRHSRDKSEAMALAQSIGEMFLSQQDFDAMLESRYGNALIREPGVYSITLDCDMSPVMQHNHSVMAEVNVCDIRRSDAGTLRRAVVSVEKFGTVLFELTVYRYDPF